MTRKKFSLSASQYPSLKTKIYNKASQEPYALILDSNSYPDQYGQYDWLAGLGCFDFLFPTDNHFEALKDYHLEKKDWLFGHLGYGLKDCLENLISSHKDKLGFGDLFFFVPKTVIYQSKSTIYIESYTLETLSELEDYLSSGSTERATHSTTTLPSLISKSEYLNNVNSLKNHLQFGDTYEVNYCIEFANTIADFSPLSTFGKLNKLGRAPFSAFYRKEHSYLLCSSPERYLQKEDNRLMAQPIKGTSKRSKEVTEDIQLKEELYINPKERSENVMIVDLLRNDLSRTAKTNSVTVEELYGIYSYETVHQMVSTITSELDNQFHFSDALRHSFPMGSMTGAPKVRAMKLIEQHEAFNRGLYSGSVGYITPSGNFDFNVVIRSLLYNAKSHYLSARVGSAITIHCDPEKEYEECLLKVQSLFECLK